MASGVTCASDAFQAIADFRKRALSLAVFRLNDDMTNIVVDKTFPKGFFSDEATGSEKLEKLKELMPPCEPRYALLDFNFNNDEGHSRENMIFVAWSPDVAKIKAKMLYASSRGYMGKSVGENVKTFQVSELCELEFNDVRSKCMKK